MRKKKQKYAGNLVCLFALISLLVGGDERIFRLITSALALFFGMDHHVKDVCEASGLSKTTIYDGAHEVIGIYEDIERQDGDKHATALAIERPNNPFKYEDEDEEKRKKAEGADSKNQPTEELTDKEQDEDSRQENNDDGSGPESKEGASLPPRRKPRKRGRKRIHPAKPKKRQRRNTKGNVGRPPVYEVYPNVLMILRHILDCHILGDPMSERLWCSTSRNHIKEVLMQANIIVSCPTIGMMLKQMGYSLQKNRKMLPVVKQHPDRNKQFEEIKRMKELAIASALWMVISIDTKKKELIGNYENKGKSQRPIGCPDDVLDHDFKDPEKGIAIPYGIYDVKANKGHVVLGRSKDTAEFAANAIRDWLKNFGCKDYPEAKNILILCDGGGSNGSRCRLWKKELVSIAKEFGLNIHVMHYPPGTSKYNPIEHRLFSEISKNWSGKPLVTIEVMYNFISTTHTNPEVGRPGLRVTCSIDWKKYETGIKVSDKEFEVIKSQIEFRKVCPQWNYIIHGADLAEVNQAENVSSEQKAA